MRFYVSLLASKSTERRIREFFQEEGLASLMVSSPLHISLAMIESPSTIIRSRVLESISVKAETTRMMILVNGGDNPERGRLTDEGKLGLRFRPSPARAAIHQLRAKVLALGRAARTARGNLNFKAHMALLRRGAIPNDQIRPLGERFRATIRHLDFDKLYVAVSSPKDG